MQCFLNAAARVCFGTCRNQHNHGFGLGDRINQSRFGCSMDPTCEQTEKPFELPHISYTSQHPTRSDFNERLKMPYKCQQTLVERPSIIPCFSPFSASSLFLSILYLRIDFIEINSSQYTIGKYAYFHFWDNPSTSLHKALIPYANLISRTLSTSDTQTLLSTTIV